MADIKFEVRIKEHRGKYIIQYANYRFFKTWKTLLHWNFQNKRYEVYQLSNIDRAKNIIWGLKTIDDVSKWYESQNKLKAKWSQ